MVDESAGPRRDPAPWWRRDRRWSNPALVAGVAALAGTVLVAIAHGVGAALGGEALFGATLAAGAVTGVRLRQAFVRRADDDVEHYSPGTPADLLPTGTTDTDQPLAHVVRGDSTLAALRRTRLRDDQHPGGVETVAVDLAGRTLHLEHRHGVPQDLDDVTGGDVPDLVVRLVDRDGTSHAGAHRHARTDHDHWTVPATACVLGFEVPHDRRPGRRTLIDAVTARAFLLSHDHRQQRLHTHLDAPPELEDPAVVLCLWLAHLVDSHTRAGEPWHAAGDVWTVVADDFPAYVGPGGFGDRRPRPVPSGGVGGGGT